MVLKAKRDSSYSDNPLTADRVGCTLISKMRLDVCYHACEVELGAREGYDFRDVQVRHSLIESNRRNFKKHRFMGDVPWGKKMGGCVGMGALRTAGS